VFANTQSLSKEEKWGGWRILTARTTSPKRERTKTTREYEFSSTARNSLRSATGGEVIEKPAGGVGPNFLRGLRKREINEAWLKRDSDNPTEVGGGTNGPKRWLMNSIRKTL